MKLQNNGTYVQAAQTNNTNIFLGNFSRYFSLIFLLARHTHIHKQTHTNTHTPPAAAMQRARACKREQRKAIERESMLPCRLLFCAHFGIGTHIDLDVCVCADYPFLYMYFVYFQVLFHFIAHILCCPFVSLHFNLAAFQHNKHASV